MTLPHTEKVSTKAAGESAEPLEPKARNLKYFGLAAGVVAAVVVYFIFPDSITPSLQENLDSNEIDTNSSMIAFTAAIAVLMAFWWMFEAIPLAATALIPLIAFPIAGVAEMKTVGASYGSPTIFLFMGGFFLALTMQRWNLHLRIALRTVLIVGTKPKQLVLGFMIATGFLSMWVSNTATAVMMLPIGISVLALVGELKDEEGTTKKAVSSNFGTALMLGIAYSASIASLSTLIGTPPNTLLRGYLEDTHDITIGFGQWMLFGAPLAWIFVFIGWWLLCKLFPPEMDELPGGRKVIEDRLHEMGPMSLQEKMTGIVFVLVALSWIFVPSFWPDTPVSDEVIAMILGLVLFLLPARPKQGIGLLDWGTAKNIPWDVLLLFGGGLALSAMFSASGLSLWIGEQASALEGLPTVFIVIGVTALVIFLTELTSNTATAAAFLPIIGAVAIGMGVDVELLVVPMALAATCAFMLPVATPPNAIAYGSGYIRIGQMIKAGIWLNIIGIILITLFTMTIGPIVLSFAL